MAGISTRDFVSSHTRTQEIEGTSFLLADDHWSLSNVHKNISIKLWTLSKGTCSPSSVRTATKNVRSRLISPCSHADIYSRRGQEPWHSHTGPVGAKQERSLMPSYGIAYSLTQQADIARKVAQLLIRIGVMGASEVPFIWHRVENHRS